MANGALQRHPICTPFRKAATHVSMLGSLRTIAITSLIVTAVGMVLPNTARAAGKDFGPWYAIVGGLTHLSKASSFDDSYGFNLRLGARQNDWFGYELNYEYIAKFDGPLVGTRRSFDEVSLHSLMPQLRLRYRFGFLEPYGILGGGVLITDVSTAADPQRTDVGFAMRTGAGLLTSFDFPVNVFVEYSRLFTSGRTTLLDYSSIGVGLEARF